jgi:cobalamin biosynthetic protein CobC
MTADLIHGGALEAMRAAYPSAPEPWIDLSTGINPWPYPNTDLSSDAFVRLPSHAAYQTCRGAMSSAINVSPDVLLLAPGSELLIRLLPTIVQARRVAVLAPSYEDHARVWPHHGAETLHTSDPLAMADEVDVVVVTHPNNPDGRTFRRAELEAARQRLAVRSGWLIVDEAYGDLAPAESCASLAGADSLIVLRSFGKFYGLAGLRLGAMLGPQSALKIMQEQLGVWPVSGAALEIGARAYADTDWQHETRQQLALARARLDGILARAGLTTDGGTDLFRYVAVSNAHSLFDRLARAGVYVRRFEGSDTHLRIGLPADKDSEERLRAALSLSA